MCTFSSDFSAFLDVKQVRPGEFTVVLKVQGEVVAPEAVNPSGVASVPPDEQRGKWSVFFFVLFIFLNRNLILAALYSPAAMKEKPRQQGGVWGRGRW